MGWKSTKVIENFEITYFRKNTFFYRTGEPVKTTKHTIIKRIQSKLQSNQSVRVDLERQRRKMTSALPRAVRRSQYQSDRQSIIDPWHQ